MANLNLNQVTLAGRLTADPELKQTTSGVPVCSFTIAISRRFSQDQTDFIDCIAWRDKAEFLCKYFRKGSSVCITGSVQKRSWNDRNGQKRYATEAVADDIFFVDSKSESDVGGDPNPTYSQSAPNYEKMNADDDLPF